MNGTTTELRHRDRTEKFVSDHALVRWIERGLGVDLSQARALAGPGAHDCEVLRAVRTLNLAHIKHERRRLNRKARIAIEMGAVAFHYQGLRFPIMNGVVVTAAKPPAQCRMSSDIEGRPKQPDWRRELEELA